LGLGTGATAAIVGGIGAAGSVASGLIGSSAAKNAANAQTQAANNAANLERQSAVDALNFNKLQYGNSLNLLSPFYNTGTAANSRLAYLMGLTPNQGLPPGVVNPNAPPTPAGSGADFGGFNALDLLGRRGLGDVGALNPATSGGAVRANAESGFVPRTGMAFDGNGLINAGINPGNTTSAAPGTVPIQNPDIGTFNAGNPGNVATASTNVGGGSQVPVLQPRANPNTPGANVPGGFGSLAQGWDKTFSSPTANDMTIDPGYQFRLNQGLQALQNSAAARGGLLSGGTAKAINDYAGGSASQEYGNVYNRALQNYNTNYNTFTNDQSNLFNRLQALAGGGQTTANQLSASGLTAANNAANIGLTSAGQIGQQLNNAGAATGSGYVGSANAITGAIGNATNSLSTLALLQSLKNNPIPAGSTGGWGVT
jgi:HPt (histidine-containing phosphotransfer) domain-containing protein